jgi:DNA helicase IV
MKYDAVIIDEGQDFRPEYWATITELIKEDGYFYIFYDPDQNIYGTSMEFPIEKEPFTLINNCRNTKTIFEKLKSYTEMEMHIIDGAPEGERVAEFRLSNDNLRRNQLRKILDALVNNQKIERDRIVILGGHSIGRTCIGNNTKVGNYQITEELDNDPNVIHYHTYMKFKGCEADVVILLDVDPKDERWADRMTLYTTISRAKHMLYILYR